MAEDGCINSGIFQNLDILGKVEFKDVEFTGNSSIGTSPSSDILTINSRIKMPNADDVEATTNTKMLVRQTDNTLKFEPKAESVFKTIAVDNQDNIVASNLTDTFTLKPGTNMTIETDTNDKSITLSSSTGSNVQNIFKTIRVDGHIDLIPDTSIDVLKFTGASNIDITPSTTTNPTTTYKAEITYDNNLFTDTDNEDKSITLYNYQTAVLFTMVTGEPSPIHKAEITYADLFYTDPNNVNKTITLFQGGTDNSNTGNGVVFTMVTGTPSELQFQKNTDVDTTATNLSTAINNHTAFSSIIDTDNNKIIVSQVLSSGGIGTTVTTFQGITINDFTLNLNDIQFKKETDVDTTATNLSTAINNHNAFSSNIDTANNKIIVTQVSSSGNPTSNTETFVSGINGPGNFSQVTQEISTLTIGLKDNKITDDLIIGDDFSDMLLVNSETTFVNNTTFTNDVKITDNLQVDNLNINGNTILATNTDGNIDITPNGTGTAVISKVDINGGNIDGTIIGATTAAVGTFTSLNVSGGNIINVDDVTLKTISYNTSSINVTYTVTVQLVQFYGSVNMYYLDNVQKPILDLEPGIYTFDQSDDSNYGHSLGFYTDNMSSGTTNQYTIDVTTNGTPGSSGAYTRIEITSSTTMIFYGCFNHANMGSQINIISSSSNITIASSWTAAGQTCANLGTVTTADINGGNIDGVAIGTNSVCTDLRVDNIQINGNTISSTSGNINITPNGTGYAVISKVDINGGDIDDTAIGKMSPAEGTFTSLNVSDGNITNVGDISLYSISADNSSSFSFGSDWTAAGRTCANLGIVTTADINGGNIDGVAIGSNTAAAGTFISLNIDNLSIDGNTISSTSGNINITSDGGKINAGTADIDSSGIIGNSNATLLGTISASTPLQPNIISIGTLTSLDISGDLSVDTNVLKVDTTNNKVGINKTTPSVALDVVGDVTMSGTLTIGSTGGENRVTYLNNSDQINTVETPGNTNVVLANTENGLEWVLYTEVATGGIDTSLVTDILSSPLDTDYYVGNDENNLFVSSGKSNFLEDVSIVDSILRIDNSSGNAIELEGSNSTSVNPTIKSTNGGINIESSQIGGTILNICNTSSGDSSIGFNVDDIINNQFTIGVDDSDENKFKIGTTSIDTNTRLTIDSSSGNVGIGTTSPDAALDVNGNIIIRAFQSGDGHGLFLRSGYAATNQPSVTVKNHNSNTAPDGISINAYDGISFSCNDVEYMRINGVGALPSWTVGNVGIGTDNPQTILHIENASHPRVRVMGVDNNTSAGIQLFENNSTSFGAELVYDGNANKVHLGCYSTSTSLRKDFTIDRPTGNVGIGTTGPTHKLHVNGDVKVENDVDINGNIDLGSTTTNGNKFIGYGTIPIGGIIMWNGETAPSGWALCNGQTVNTHTTPDIRGRFIMGATYGSVDFNSEGSVDREVGETGGEEEVILSTEEMPSHTHGPGTYDTGIGGNHQHDYKDAVWDAQAKQAKFEEDEDQGHKEDHTRTTTTHGGHSHEITIGVSGSTGQDGPHENRPPYYVLAYIMRVY